MTPSPATPALRPSPTFAPQQQAHLDSRQLFGAAREVLIHHGGQVYRLRHTSTGKLILTK